MSKNGLITLSRPFNDRLNTKRLMNNKNAATGPTAKASRARRITIATKVIS